MTLAEYRELRSQKVVEPPAPIVRILPGNRFFTLWNAAEGWIYEDKAGDLWVTKGENMVRWLRYDEQGHEILPGGKWTNWVPGDDRKSWAPFTALRPATEAELTSAGEELGPF